MESDDLTCARLVEIACKVEVTKSEAHEIARAAGKPQLDKEIQRISKKPRKYQVADDGDSRKAAGTSEAKPRVTADEVNILLCQLWVAKSYCRQFCVRQKARYANDVKS